MSIDPGVFQIYTHRRSVHFHYPLSLHAHPCRWRLFSQRKILLTDRRNRLQIDSLQAVECIKSWDALQIGLPQVVVTGAQLEDAGKAELDIDQA
jgi:hypothetical protein